MKISVSPLAGSMAEAQNPSSVTAGWSGHPPGCTKTAFGGGGVGSAPPLCSAAELPTEVRFFPDAAPAFLRLFLAWDAFLRSSTVGRTKIRSHSRQLREPRSIPHPLGLHHPPVQACNQNTKRLHFVAYSTRHMPEPYLQELSEW